MEPDADASGTVAEVPAGEAAGTVVDKGRTPLFSSNTMDWVAMSYAVLRSSGESSFICSVL